MSGLPRCAWVDGKAADSSALRLHRAWRLALTVPQNQVSQ